MKFDLNRSLWREVEKLSLILAGEVVSEAPNDTQIQSPTTATVLSCCDIGLIVSVGGLESFLPMKSTQYWKATSNLRQFLFSEKFISISVK